MRMRINTIVHTMEVKGASFENKAVITGGRYKASIESLKLTRNLIFNRCFQLNSYHYSS